MTNDIEIRYIARAEASQLKPLENQIDQVAAATRESANAFRLANATSIQLKTEYRNLDRAGKLTAEGAQKLSAEIDAAQAEEQKAINTTRQLVSEYQELARQTDRTSSEHAEFGRELNDLTARMDKAQGHIDGITPAAKRQTAAIGDLRGEVTGLGDRLTSFSEKALTSFVNAVGGFAVDALAQAGRAVLQFVGESTEAFSQFEEEATRAFVQIPDMSDEMRASLMSDAKAIAREIGYLPEDVLPALRKGLNLGAGENQLFDELVLSANAARVAGADLTETYVAARQPVNAYGDDILDLAQVLDTYAFIVQNTSLEQADLNNGMSQILSPAAEAGVAIDQVAAAIVTMNRQGDDWNEIGQLLSNMLTQIQIEGTALGGAFKDAAGIGFKEFIAQGGTMLEAMELLQRHADATGESLLNMVGGSSPFFRDVQAARAVVELTGQHLGDLREATIEAGDAQGTTASQVAELNEQLFVLENQAAASTEVLKLQIGEALEPGKRGWLELKTAVTDYFAADLAARQSAIDSAEALKQQGLAGLELEEALGAVRGSFSFWRDDWLRSEEQMKRLPVVLQLIESGFEGTGGELLNLTNQMVENAEVAASADIALLNYVSSYQQAEEQIGHTAAQLSDYDLALREHRRLLTFNAQVASQEAEAATAAAEAEAEAIRQAEEAKQAAYHSSYTAAFTASEQAIQSNEDLGQSYIEMAADAIYAAQGATDSTIDLQVALGLITEETAEARKEYAFMRAEMESFAESAEFAALSTERQVQAIQGLQSGRYQSAEEATTENTRIENINLQYDNIANFYDQTDGITATLDEIEVEDTTATIEANTDPFYEDYTQVKSWMSELAQGVTIPIYANNQTGGGGGGGGNGGCGGPGQPPCPPEHSVSRGGVSSVTIVTSGRAATNTALAWAEAVSRTRQGSRYARV